MSLVSVDDSLVIQAAQHNPDARPVLKALFPDVFKPKVPQIGQNYVRGARIYVVASITDAYSRIMYFLVDVKNGLLWAQPTQDPTQIFGVNTAEFKKCTITVQYTEL